MTQATREGLTKRGRPTRHRAHAADNLAEVISSGDLDIEFQPIVALDSDTPVAYEALSRGPAGSSLRSPSDLFQRARELNLTAALDAACREAALAAARSEGFRNAHSLFINLEPESLTGHEPIAWSAFDLPHVMEITERALLADPAGLMEAVTRARAAGHRIAIDDLGAEPASLMLLPLLQPDVVKLDMALIRERPTVEVARIMSALGAYAESAPTVVLAEGIETERHRVTALALGATHGQGWLFGHPVAEVPAAATLRGMEFASDAVVPQSDAGATPYEVAARGRVPRSSNRALLVEMSKFLEARAAASGDSALVLATFQNQSNLTPATMSRYRHLGARAGLVAAFVDGDARFDARDGIRTSPISADDALAREWDIVVLTADFSAVLAAVETNPGNHDVGEYDFVLTHDRPTVVEAAKTLIRRLPPTGR